MEKFARQAVSDGVEDSEGLVVTRDSELFRVLSLHYNKSNDFHVSFFTFLFSLYIPQGGTHDWCGQGGAIQGLKPIPISKTHFCRKNTHL